MKPYYIHSGMAGAPQYTTDAGGINNILEVCLTLGFNSKTATSASASGGILTLNFAADPQFEAQQTVEVAVSSVGLVNGIHRVVANSSNQVTIAIPGLPDGPVGSSGAGITIKQASAGWSKPFGSTTTAVFRPAAGNRRYLKLINAAGANLTVSAFEDMTDINTGTGGFPSTPVTALYNTSYGNNTTGNAWFLIATAKWVIFSTYYISQNAPAGVLFFGDLAHLVVPNDLYSTALFVPFTRRIARRYTGNTGAVTAYFNDADKGGDWPSPINSGLRLIPYVPVSDGSATDVMRGVIPNAYLAFPASTVLSFSDMYTNVVGINGRVKPLSFRSPNSSREMAIAIDEEVWD